MAPVVTDIEWLLSFRRIRHEGLYAVRIDTIVAGRESVVLADDLEGRLCRQDTGTKDGKEE
jgi:hypothetical protein